LLIPVNAMPRRVPPKQLAAPPSTPSSSRTASR
jgi:hypothetical protein